MPKRAKTAPICIPRADLIALSQSVQTLLDFVWKDLESRSWVETLHALQDTKERLIHLNQDLNRSSGQREIPLR